MGYHRLRRFVGFGAVCIGATLFAVSSLVASPEKGRGSKLTVSEVEPAAQSKASQTEPLVDRLWSRVLRAVADTSEQFSTNPDDTDVEKSTGVINERHTPADVAKSAPRPNTAGTTDQPGHPRVFSKYAPLSVNDDKGSTKASQTTVAIEPAQRTAASARQPVRTVPAVTDQRKATGSLITPDEGVATNAKEPLAWSAPPVTTKSVKVQLPSAPRASQATNYGADDRWASDGRLQRHATVRLNDGRTRRTTDYGRVNDTAKIPSPYAAGSKRTGATRKVHDKDARYVSHGDDKEKSSRKPKRRLATYTSVKRKTLGKRSYSPRRKYSQKKVSRTCKRGYRKR